MSWRLREGKVRRNAVMMVMKRIWIVRKVTFFLDVMTYLPMTVSQTNCWNKLLRST